jgi:hypothetical protein
MYGAGPGEKRRTGRGETELVGADCVGVVAWRCWLGMRSCGVGLVACQGGSGASSLLRGGSELVRGRDVRARVAE